MMGRNYKSDINDSQSQKTQGEDRHHGVHVFLILQNPKLPTGIKAVFGIDTKLNIYNNYTNSSPKETRTTVTIQGQKR